jgi:nucleoside-diphosphate-sugar epimerase
MSGKVLIAGCGDLGRRVARQLLEGGNEVYALRRNPPADDDSGVHWLGADLADAQSLRDLPAGTTQLVYTPTPDARDEMAYRRTFVEGLRHLLTALDQRSLQRVLFVSSSAVYGDHGDEWVDEDTQPVPPGFNGTVLLEAEAWLMSQPVRSVVLRLAGIYGPGRMHVIEQLRAGTARVPRQPRHWANRIHIDDAAAAIVHLLSVEKPKSLYLGVDDTPLPLDVLYDDLAALIHAPVVAEGAAPAGVGSKRLSNARLRASGFHFHWPDSRSGYAELLNALKRGDQ